LNELMPGLAILAFLVALLFCLIITVLVTPAREPGRRAPDWLAGLFLASNPWLLSCSVNPTGSILAAGLVLWSTVHWLRFRRRRWVSAAGYFLPVIIAPFFATSALLAPLAHMAAGTRRSKEGSSPGPEATRAPPGWWPLAALGLGALAAAPNLLGFWCTAPVLSVGHLSAGFGGQALVTVLVPIGGPGACLALIAIWLTPKELLPRSDLIRVLTVGISLCLAAGVLTAVGWQVSVPWLAVGAVAIARPFSHLRSIRPILALVLVGLAVLLNVSHAFLGL
jgi:hypothetical protein